MIRRTDRVLDFSKIAAGVGAELKDVDIVVTLGISMKDGSLTVGSASKLIEITDNLLIRILEESLRLIRGDA